jgi:subtilisin family serine protease
MAVALILLVSSTITLSLAPGFGPRKSRELTTQPQSKLAPNLASLLRTEPSDCVVGIIADLRPGVDWRAAQRAILQASTITKIQAYSSLLHAISMRTTLGELDCLADLACISSIWLDARAQLDNSLSVTPSRVRTAGPNQASQLAEVVGSSRLAQLGLNGSRTVVAILDTGIDATHPDLDDLDDNQTTNDPKVLGQVSFAEGDPFPFDLNGHGTYCAGLVAGTGAASNGTYAGIAPGAQLLSAKVILPDGTSYTSWIVRGIEWSITHGADIILIPFSTFGYPGDPLSEAIRLATEQGILVVVAAGDRGPNHMTVLSPGECIDALTVGAYNISAGMVADFSSRGPTFDLRSKPDLVAPGTDVISCALHDVIPAQVGNQSISITSQDLSMFGFGQFGTPVNGNYTLASTTAASAAIVCGVASLLLQGCRYATPQCLSIGMRGGAHSLQGEPNVEGNGLLNASAAYDELAQLHDPLTQTFRSRSVTPGLPYYGVMMNQADGQNTTLLLSTYASALAAVVTSNMTNATIIHMLLGTFYLAVENGSPTPLALLHVEEEMHWTTLPTANYARATGVLSYEDLLVIPRIESWHLSDVPLANAFRFALVFMNVGSQAALHVRLYSLWDVDLFYGVNQTSAEQGLFNGTSQLFHVTSQWLPPNASGPIDQVMALNSSTPLAQYEVGRYDQVRQHLQDEVLNGSSSYSSQTGVGFATGWLLGDIAPGAATPNVSLTISFGMTLSQVIQATGGIGNATGPLSLADLCLIRVVLPRTGTMGVAYHTSALVLNIGDAGIDSLAAFLTNRTQPMGGTVFARYFQLGRVEPFKAVSLALDWNPETSDIYFAGWGAAPQLILEFYNLSMPQDQYALDNVLFRDVFISTPPTMRIVVPGKLPYGPMTLQFPNDYAIYNISLLTSTPIDQLEIVVSGEASSWISVTPVTLHSIRSSIQFQLTILVPSFLEAGNHTATIWLSASDGWQASVPLVVVIRYPKAIILFDTVHNTGLSLAGLGDLANLNLTSLLAAFAEMSDSVLTGYSSLRQLFAQADLSLTEIPYLQELNDTILGLFDGLILCDPERGFTPTELTNITGFIDAGFKTLVFADSPAGTNHTALNQLLAPFGIQLAGTVNAANTSELAAASPFTQGLHTVTTTEGTTLQLAGPPVAFAWMNGTPIGAYDGSQSHELFVFGSAATFSNSYLFELDNRAFASQSVSYLFRRTVDIKIEPTGGNGSTFVVGHDAGFVIDATNRTGSGVSGLKMYVLYQLANGSTFFFTAFEVKDGRYGTFLFANWTGNTAGDYVIFVFTLPGNYSSTMASMRFTYVPAPPVQPPPPTPDYFALMLVEITWAIILAVLVISAYFGQNYRRRRRMRTPIISEQLVQRVDNALNTTQALIRELEWIITDRRLERLEKLNLSAGEIADRLEDTLKTLKGLARETGA